MQAGNAAATARTLLSDNFQTDYRSGIVVIGAGRDPEAGMGRNESSSHNDLRFKTTMQEG